jgi:hypothetical protein
MCVYIVRLLWVQHHTKMITTSSAISIRCCLRPKYYRKETSNSHRCIRVTKNLKHVGMDTEVHWVQIAVTPERGTSINTAVCVCLLQRPLIVMVSTSAREEPLGQTWDIYVWFKWTWKQISYTSSLRGWNFIMKFRTMPFSLRSEKPSFINKNNVRSLETKFYNLYPIR